ncbi:hypothetical protein DW855_07630 [Faecalibacterium prausnitzii]|uniref:Uncharacterized protein n=1 Tax=Faecalibacterium prausnitzii TaxID=853 RepID=A0A3E2W4W4_9FIRM|nr:hypothetical protein [Faecalibacterium prausnitzii]RGC19287.1 hypothetical protein DW855_07630 [Faecalibacterium prausnitzii]
MRLNDNNTFIGINPPYQLSVIHSSKLIYPRELSQYEYDTDKDGNFLPSVPDRDNHTCDATVYSLDRLIFNKNEGA